MKIHYRAQYSPHWTHSDILELLILRTLRTSVHVAGMSKTRNTYSVLVEKSEPGDR